MATVDHFINRAEEEIGKNQEKYNMWYWGYLGENWCAAFLSWVAEKLELGIDDPGGFKSAAVSSIYAVLPHVAIRSLNGVKRGDFVCFNWNRSNTSTSWMDHIGVVEWVDTTTGQYGTIEGNTGGGGTAATSLVMRKTHSISNYFTAFCRPPYSTSGLRPYTREYSTGDDITINSYANSKYVCNNLDFGNAPIHTNKAVASTWERFDITLTGDKWIALKSRANGKYLSARLDLSQTSAPLFATSDQIGSWERFRIYRDGLVSHILSQANGRYLSTMVNLSSYAPVHAQALQPLAHEKFRIMGPTPGVPESGGGCPYSEPMVNVQTGSTGEGVRWVQWYLNRRGAGLAVDGIFGSATNVAVRNFQSNNGLSVDGIVGPATRAALKNSSSGGGSSGNLTGVTYSNGSTNEPTYSTTANAHALLSPIGYLYPWEIATCYGKIENCYALVYNTVSSKKASFVTYAGGVGSVRTSGLTYQNGSTTEPVYATIADAASRVNSIGYLYAWEACECFAKVDGYYLVIYNASGTKKIGFVVYSGGIA